MRLVWGESAWEDYRHWPTADRKIVKGINTLVDARRRGDVVEFRFNV